MLDDSLGDKIIYFVVHILFIACFQCFVILGVQSISWLFKAVGILFIALAVFSFFDAMFLHLDIMGALIGVRNPDVRADPKGMVSGLVVDIIFGIIIFRGPKLFNVEGFFMLLMIYIFATILGIKFAKENRAAKFESNLVVGLGEYAPLFYMVVGTVSFIFYHFHFPLWISIVMMGLANVFHLFRVALAYKADFE